MALAQRSGAAHRPAARHHRRRAFLWGRRDHAGADGAVGHALDTYVVRSRFSGHLLPSLVLNYLGQGALLIAHPEAIKNPKRVPWAAAFMTSDPSCASTALMQSLKH